MPNPRRGPGFIHAAQYESRENEVFSITFEVKTRSFPGQTPHAIAQNRAVFSVFEPPNRPKRPWRSGNRPRPPKKHPFSGGFRQNNFSEFSPKVRHSLGAPGRRWTPRAALSSVVESGIRHPKTKIERVPPSSGGQAFRVDRRPVNRAKSGPRAPFRTQTALTLGWDIPSIECPGRPSPEKTPPSPGSLQTP